MLSEPGQYCEGLHFKHVNSPVQNKTKTLLLTKTFCSLILLNAIGSNTIIIFFNLSLNVKACLLFYMSTDQMFSSKNVLYFRNMDGDLFMECEEEELEPWQQLNSTDDSGGNAESITPIGVSFHRFSVTFIVKCMFI